MKCLLLAAACVFAAIVPVETVVEDRATVAELNHLYDDEGREAFAQLVLWEFCPCRECEHCVAWRLVKHPGMRPEYDRKRGLWVATFQDGEVTRRILADCFRETWTQEISGGDPELRDRARYPKEMRRELSHPTAARPR